MKSFWIAALALATPLAALAQFLAPSDFSISASAADSAVAAPSRYTLEDQNRKGKDLRAAGRVFKISLAERCGVQAKSCTAEIRVDADAPRPGGGGAPALHWTLWGKASSDTVRIVSNAFQDGNLGRVLAEIGVRHGDSVARAEGRTVGETGSPRRMAYFLKIVLRKTLSGGARIAVYARIGDKSYRMPLAKAGLPEGFSPDSMAFRFETGNAAATPANAAIANLLVLEGGRHFVTATDGGYLEMLAAGGPPAEHPRDDYFSEALLKLIRSSGGDEGTFGTFEEHSDRNRNLVAASEETLVLPIQALRTRIVTKDSLRSNEREIFICTLPWREFDRSKALLSLNPGFLLGEEKVSEAVVKTDREEAVLRFGEYLELDFTERSEIRTEIRVKYRDGFEGAVTLLLRSTAFRQASLQGNER